MAVNKIFAVNGQIMKNFIGKIPEICPNAIRLFANGEDEFIRITSKLNSTQKKNAFRILEEFKVRWSKELLPADSALKELKKFNDFIGAIFTAGNINS